MPTFHIHIRGLVQGVGFRPHVCQVAELMQLNGCVSNTSDGVHIAINATPEQAKKFYDHLVRHQPVNAMITDHTISEIEHKTFSNFSIIHSIPHAEPDLLLTPDIAICDTCRQEIHDPANRRHGYAFTTCLNCGPRYSILKALPYDRINTTMEDLAMCPSCTAEYEDHHNRRHYSQTNSCPDCRIVMHYFSKTRGHVTETNGEDKELISMMADDLLQGKILAVKGTGGYLLLCDATNEEVIRSLRSRKKRPAKPLAVLYPNIEMAKEDFLLRQLEIDALGSRIAPVVLCRPKPGVRVCANEIAPALDKIGIMMPSTPLLELIAQAIGRPLVATSGNISGSPIIYKDDEALSNLFEVADHILTYDREIVAPQDDSVMLYTEHDHRIILRRSRGLAPNYYPSPFESHGESVLAMGSELKSSFAIQQKSNLYLSQYLGDQGTLESQGSYAHTLQHIRSLLHSMPDTIMVDKHPGYAVSAFGRKLAEELAIEPFQVQHHHAHFGAVLAENNLLESKDHILGFVWDGTGYGDDEQIWGGEVFCLLDGHIERKLHLKYIPQLMGDKMSLEPRLSALSLLHDLPRHQHLVRSHFTDAAWNYYQRLFEQDQKLQTSSMGRFLDGLACLLGVGTHNSFEGEAAMKLEALASQCRQHQHEYHYSLPITEGIINTRPMVEQLAEDLLLGDDKCWLALKVFHTLVKLVEDISDHYKTDHIAFSGGVFQNALLNDLITKQLGLRKSLYFHKQLSPNDECIGFGQLAIYHLHRNHPKNILTDKHVFSHPW
jgi:hydrogenase maturation protein HypF